MQKELRIPFTETTSSTFIYEDLIRFAVNELCSIGSSPLCVVVLNFLLFELVSGHVALCSFVIEGVRRESKSRDRFAFARLVGAEQILKLDAGGLLLWLLSEKYMPS